MTQYRKKPVVIEAVQWTGANWGEVAQLAGPARDRLMVVSNRRLLITTLEGIMEAQPGDWIIRGVKGELYPCKPHIFEDTYEAVEAQVDHE